MMMRMGRTVDGIGAMLRRHIEAAVAIFFFAMPIITPWWRRLRALPVATPVPPEA
jgi:hypothetical protein